MKYGIEIVENKREGKLVRKNTIKTRLTAVRGYLYKYKSKKEKHNAMARIH